MNIYSLREAVLTCDHQITALVGPNDAGKSNILRAINLVSGKEPPLKFDSAKRCLYGDGEPMIELDFIAAPNDQHNISEILSLSGAPTPPFHLLLRCQNDTLAVKAGSVDRHFSGSEAPIKS